MNLDCLSGIVKDGLAIHIDVSDGKSWDLNTGYTSVSLNQWSGAFSDKIDLLDFGLTAYDNGRVDNTLDNLMLTPDDLKFTLYRVGYNNATGGTFYDLYPMTAITSASTVGNYFDLDGGYLQGFFKLEDYDFEQLPQRYNEGVTIETLIKIDDDSQGIFYYMGTRAEDKYNPFFSGETKKIITEETVKVRTGVVGFTDERTVTSIDFSGVTTSEDNYLNAYLDETKLKTSFIDYADRLETKPVEQARDSINENIIAFGLNADKRIFIKRVDENGIVKTDVSSQVVTSTGWTMINITYKPYEVFDEDSFDAIKECAFARDGDLIISVNGKKFWKKENYKELPYNISWGGGSFGLKHSWHYDLMTYNLYDGNDTTYINNNFDLVIYPLKDDPCDDIIDISSSGTSGLQFSANSTTFTTVDNTCDPPTETPRTVFQVKETGTTAQTVGNQYFIEYTQVNDILSNRDYTISAKIWEKNIFKSGTDNLIRLIAYDTGNTDSIEVVEQTVYAGGGANKWIDLKLKIRTKDNSGLEKVKIGLLIQSNKSLKDEFILYVDDFEYSGSDALSQDPRKDNLTVENNFDSSYIGGIQKLRIYDIPFTQQMTLHNAKIEFSKTNNYGRVVNGGGRIITKE